MFRLTPLGLMCGTLVLGLAGWSAGGFALAVLAAKLSSLNIANPDVPEGELALTLGTMFLCVGAIICHSL